MKVPTDSEFVFITTAIQFDSKLLGDEHSLCKEDRL